MKSYVAFLVLLVVIVAVDCARDPQKQNRRRKVARGCMKETKVALGTIRDYRKGDLSDDSENGKCFMKCFGSKMGMFEAIDGTVTVNDAFVNSYLDDIVTDLSAIPEIVNKCKNVDYGANACDYAFNAYKCFNSETRSKEILDETESTFDAILNDSNTYRFGLKDEDLEETAEEVAVDAAA